MIISQVVLKVNKVSRTVYFTFMKILLFWL